MFGAMTQRFLAVTVSLAATVAFLIGLVVAGSMTPARAVSGTTPQPVPARGASAGSVSPERVSFADIAERLNPAVVSIDATSRGEARRGLSLLPDTPEPFERPGPRDRGPRRGAGSGARPGDILTMYVYKPEINQRALEIIKIDER